MTSAVNPPPFAFRLERVRALRERAEQRAEELLAASLAEHRRGEERLDAAAQRVSDAHSGRRKAATVSGADLVAHQAYMERAERARQAAALDLGRREADVDASRGALVRAARDHRALQRLKERRGDEHAQQAQRVAGIALDEMALIQHARGAGR